MKNAHFSTTKIRQTNQFWVKYRPTDAQESKPFLGALGHALGTYSRVPGDTAFRTLKEAAFAARTRYPLLGLEILKDGQEMFPATPTDATH